jgi:hypothetical protein
VEAGEARRRQLGAGVDHLARGGGLRAALPRGQGPRRRKEGPAPTAPAVAHDRRQRGLRLGRGRRTARSSEREPERLAGLGPTGQDPPPVHLPRAPARQGRHRHHPLQPGTAAPLATQRPQHCRLRPRRLLVL